MLESIFYFLQKKEISSLNNMQILREFIVNGCFYVMQVDRKLIENSVRHVPKTLAAELTNIWMNAYKYKYGYARMHCTALHIASEQWKLLQLMKNTKEYSHIKSEIVKVHTHTYNCNSIWYSNIVISMFSTYTIYVHSEISHEFTNELCACDNSMFALLSWPFSLSMSTFTMEISCFEFYVADSQVISRKYCTVLLLWRSRCRKTKPVICSNYTKCFVCP